MHFPLGSFPNVKPAFRTLLAKRVVNRECPSDALYIMRRLSFVNAE
jgi:hypothetical protein